MCGIFGFIVPQNEKISLEEREKLLTSLFVLSESRGKEAAGLAVVSEKKVTVYKQPVAAGVMLKQSSYQNFVYENFSQGANDNFPSVVIGHARLVTNGSSLLEANNQPVVKDGLVAVHNGIVVNDEQIWRDFPQLKRLYQVDTEVVVSLIKNFVDAGYTLTEAVNKTYGLIEGTASLAILFTAQNYLLLATNNGSLWLARGQWAGMPFLIFASEKYILEQLMTKNFLRQNINQLVISQLPANKARLFDIKDITLNSEFSLLGEDDVPNAVMGQPASSAKEVKVYDAVTSPAVLPEIQPDFSVSQDLDKFVERFINGIGQLKRCTRCILPETFPFIKFDEAGVCNYCCSYRPVKAKGVEALKNFLAPYRSKNGAADCVVAFSGGRDSSYGLHYLKKVLGMQPVAYSYDWGMLTDLGRRNQARMTGKLGIEHILVSADIQKKRANIKKNVLAWLKKPELGTVPLFMAGDKQFFYYANQVKKQLGVKLAVMCQNPLEKTYFKSGFCGVRPAGGNVNRDIYDLSWRAQLKQGAYYARNFLTNPAYFNSSILDTLSAYAMYYLIPHNYLFLFEYLTWDEREIESVLLQEYNWETVPDRKSTWRIGDATAPFYNYIYYSVAGFTENDTFRSNQIREGAISRAEALARANEENQPRLEAFKWYCDTNGLDFLRVITRINAMPKLYNF